MSCLLLCFLNVGPINSLFESATTRLFNQAWETHGQGGKILSTKSETLSSSKTSTQLNYPRSRVPKLQNSENIDNEDNEILTVCMISPHYGVSLVFLLNSE